MKNKFLVLTTSLIITFSASFAHESTSIPTEYFITYKKNKDLSTTYKSSGDDWSHYQEM